MIANDSLRCASQVSRRWSLSQSPYEPNYEVIVLVVNEGGDATVWVDLEVVGGLMLPFLEGQINGLVSQS